MQWWNTSCAHSHAPRTHQHACARSRNSFGPHVFFGGAGGRPALTRIEIAKRRRGDQSAQPLKRQRKTRIGRCRETHNTERKQRPPCKQQAATAATTQLMAEKQDGQLQTATNNIERGVERQLRTAGRKGMEQEAHAGVFGPQDPPDRLQRNIPIAASPAAPPPQNAWNAQRSRSPTWVLSPWRHANSSSAIQRLQPSSCASARTSHWRTRQTAAGAPKPCMSTWTWRSGPK